MVQPFALVAERMLNKDDYLKIYQLLDAVNPLPYDCGTLCSSICCRYEQLPNKEDLYLFMLPGEEMVHDRSDPWLSWQTHSTQEFGFPASWGKAVYTVQCRGPESCKRLLRPIQCRTYPLEPYITRKHKLALVYCDHYHPYDCPLIEKKAALSQEFLKATYKAWEMLIKDDSIRDYVEADSKHRYSIWYKNKIVYFPDFKK